jgi:hypothetical protein
MKSLLIILILLLACPCMGQTGKTASFSGPDKFFEINYEDILKNKKVVPLSQVASNVEYIKLETNKDCLIGGIRECLFTDNLIFINNRDHILKFSRDGKFLQKIGNPGRGPGEIDLIRTMSLITDKRIIAVQKNAIREMLYFSFDGAVIKTVKIPSALYIKVMDDARFIAYDAGADGSNINTFSLINEKGDTISAIKNYCTWKNTTGSVMMAGSYPVPFTSRKIWYCKDRYNDTIYTIFSNKIIPSYAIKLGKYKLPDELRLERLYPDRAQVFLEKAPNFFHTMLFEAADKLFIIAECFGKGENKYLLYDKQERIGTLLNNGPNSSTGFINDLDGGIDFWPIGSVNDNQVYRPLNIVSLKKGLENKSEEITVKYPDKKKALEKLISDSDISDNPILMIVTLKSR